MFKKLLNKLGLYTQLDMRMQGQLAYEDGLEQNILIASTQQASDYNATRIGFMAELTAKQED